MRVGIKGRVHGETCGDVAYAIVYGLHVILDPMHNSYNIVQGDPGGILGIALLHKGRR